MLKNLFIMIDVVVLFSMPYSISRKYLHVFNSVVLFSKLLQEMLLMIFKLLVTLPY